MLLAQNTAERVRTYRKALHADPRIARLQILDMSRPLEVTDIFVRVRVHEEARLLYDIDPLLSEAEKQRDPNMLLQAGRKYLLKSLAAPRARLRFCGCTARPSVVCCLARLSTRR